MAKIYYAADSTVQFNSYLTYPQTGISQGLRIYIRDDVEIKSYARNGRSTKSFLEEGRFARIEKEMQEGDFLFIQFGHNDEKKADPNRFTEPDGAFTDNLKYMIRAAKKAGAYPVVISPIYRRHFGEDGKTLDYVHLNYPEYMEKAAKEENVPYIDLCALSRAYLDEIGDEASLELYMHFGPGLYPNFPEGKEDDTHLRYPGAVKYAGMIAEELKKIGGVYADLVLTKWPMTENGPWE